MNPTYPLVPVLNFCAACLVALPFLANPRGSWNIGIVLLAAWNFLLSLVLGIDAVIWSNNTRNSAPIWCDIVSHIIVGAESGMSACTLVITHHLYDIARLCVATPGTRMIRARSMFDISLGILFPLMIIALYYIVQSSRFEIYEKFGCWFSVDVSWLSVLLLNSSGVAFPMIAIVFYCPTITRVFCGQLTETDSFNDSYRAMARRQYVRVLAVGFTDILFTLPVGIFLIVDTVKGASERMVFYQGWNIVHSDWSPRFHSALEWESEPWTAWRLRFDQHITIVFAVGFFIGFGLTEEALLGYQRVLNALGLGWIHIKKDMPSDVLSAFEAATRPDNDLDSSAASVSTTDTPTALLSSPWSAYDEISTPHGVHVAHDLVEHQLNVIVQDPQKHGAAVMRHRG
ncbi:pheromone A receptor-domain-containing protein [Amylostereum chailletii]|nr:pheromone A receptor-domain-containing protein [Amylostereum chailletii]